LRGPRFDISHIHPNRKGTIFSSAFSVRHMASIPLLSVSQRTSPFFQKFWMMLKRKTCSETNDVGSPWKKLNFDDVEDKYIHTEPSIQLKPMKSVHFSKHRGVVEVPSRYDYLQAGIKLWWSKHDMDEFYRDSVTIH
jgi:hypothetical protein